MTMDAHRAFLSIIILATASPVFGQVPCEFEWPGPAESATLDGPITSMIVFDEDGLGGDPPYLVASGPFDSTDFGNLGKAPLHGVARWDGAVWAPMGNGFPDWAQSMERRRFAVLDQDADGPLPARLFAWAPLQINNGYRLVEWTGTTWDIAAKNSLYGYLNGLCVYDDDGPGPHSPELFAIGQFFSNSNPYIYSTLAMLKGDEWRLISSDNFLSIGFNAVQLRVTENGPSVSVLCESGSFVNDDWIGINGVAIRYPAGKIKMTTYDAPVGQAVSFGPLAVLDIDGEQGPQEPCLFAGGSFPIVAGVVAGVARWDGTRWMPTIGIGGTSSAFPMSCSSLLVSDSVGPSNGSQSLIAADDQGFIWQWDGWRWNDLSSGLMSYSWGAMATFDDDDEGPHAGALYVGSGATVPGSPLSFMGSISRWTGCQWVPLLGDGLSVGTSFSPQPPYITGIAVSPRSTTSNNESLYVSGYFFSAGGVPCSGLVRYVKGAWATIASDYYGWPVTVLTISADNSQGHDLVVAGAFNQIDGVSADNIAIWDGQAWRALGDGLAGDDNIWVSSLAVYDPDGPGPMQRGIVAGGYFEYSGDTVLNNIAFWNGDCWTPLGDGSHYGTTKVLAFDEDGPGPAPETLYAAGSFNIDGEDDPVELARWNGTYWKRLGDEDLRFHDAVVGIVGDETVASLYVGGFFLEQGNHPVLQVAKWNGREWAFLPTGFSDYPYIYGMTIMDADADGPEPPMLFVAGSFNLIGGVAVQGLARWDGHQWYAVKVRQESFFAGPLTLCPYDDDSSGPHLPRLMIGGYSGLTQWGPPLPYFRWQPEHMTAALGGTAMFQVRMGGAEPMTYQWRKDGIPLSETRRVSGVKRPLLKIERAMTTDVGQYDVIVTNHCGSQVSRAAALKIDEKQSAVHE